ncbi:hypothetical protein MMC19_003750 [Ptychographa xylographoides]|nr:hypothetical protein [Ptychographa xylographoides]
MPPRSVKQTRDLTASIYMDIHIAAKNHVEGPEEPEPEEATLGPIYYLRAWYKIGFYDDLPDFVNLATENFGGQSESWNIAVRTMTRYGHVADDSMMMLAILAHSESFRRACLEDSILDWCFLIHDIKTNFESIEYFAKSRGLKWKSLLSIDKFLWKKISDMDPDHIFGQRLLMEKPEHPHTRVVPEYPGQPRYPRTEEGKLQINILANIWRKDLFEQLERPDNWPHVWDYPSDPTIRLPGRECIYCGFEKICQCNALRHDHPLVELRYYAKYGELSIGVRALQKIAKGAQVGEYIGEIIPLMPYNIDSIRTYAFEFDIQEEPYMTECTPLALISPHQYGNWTRFMNHSCDASVTEQTMTIGDRMRIMLTATRDIEPFDEITLDYGPDYFRNMRCLCGSDNCLHSDLDEEDASTEIDERDEDESDSEDRLAEDGGSEDGGSEDGSSEDEGSEDGGSEDEGSEDGDSEDGDSEVGGSEDGDSEVGGSEDRGSEDGGSEDWELLQTEKRLCELNL